MQGSDTADQEELDLDGVTVPRSKPFKYAYEKEIVMYAYFKKLDYFSTECIYSPNAYRGHARAYIKDLEKIRPSAILVRGRFLYILGQNIWETLCGSVYFLEKLHMNRDFAQCMIRFPFLLFPC